MVWVFHSMHLLATSPKLCWCVLLYIRLLLLLAWWPFSFLQGLALSYLKNWVRFHLHPEHQLNSLFTSFFEYTYICKHTDHTDTQTQRVEERETDRRGVLPLSSLDILPSMHLTNYASIFQCCLSCPHNQDLYNAGQYLKWVSSHFRAQWTQRDTVQQDVFKDHASPFKEAWEKWTGGHRIRPLSLFPISNCIQQGIFKPFKSRLESG